MEKKDHLTYFKSNSYLSAYNFWISLILVLLVLTIYYQVRNFEFINYDDHAYVTSNYYVLNGISKASLKWVLLADVGSNWHPLTMLTHMLDVALYGFNAGAHHLTNVQFHILNTILMFLVFRLLTGDLWKPAFIAAIFAVHPLHAESVAWVSERKDVLSACFWLLTMLSYVWYHKKPSRLKYWLTLLGFSIGLLAKPMLVTLPFVLLLMDYWPLRRFENGRGEIIEAILEKLPFLIITISFSIITFFIQKLTGAVSDLSAFPWFVRAANTVVSYVTYIYQTFWPVRLSVFYPYPSEFSLATYVSAGAFILTLSILSWVFRRRFPYLFVGWFWFFGTLIPVIGIVQVGMQAHADRYMYIPMTGLMIAVLYGSADFFQHFRVSRTYVVALMVSITICISYLGYQQVSRWQNSYTLFEQAIENTHNNELAYYSAGTYLYNQGHHEKALAYLERARQISPNDPYIYLNLYAIVQNKKDSDKMDAYYQSIQKLNPTKGALQARLGVIELNRKDYAKAETYFRKALSFNSADADSLNFLGIAVEEQGRPYEGLSYFKHAEELKPENSFIQRNLGIAYRNLGRLEDAIIHSGKALSLDPGNNQYLEQFRSLLKERKKLKTKSMELQAKIAAEPNAAESLLELALIDGLLQRQNDELKHLEEAVKAKPDFSEGLDHLGIAYARRGRYGDALGNFQKLSKLEPNESKWDYKIATVQARMGASAAACTSLQAAIEKGYPNNDKVRTDPNFDPIRESECFRSIVGQ